MTKTKRLIFHFTAPHIKFRIGPQREGHKGALAQNLNPEIRFSYVLVILKSNYCFENPKQKEQKIGIITRQTQTLSLAFIHKVAC